MILIGLPIGINQNDSDQMIGLDVLETVVIENILDLDRHSCMDMVIIM